MNLDDFLERMDHEFGSAANLSITKLGYRVDDKHKSTKRGIKSIIKCEAYKSTDYITFEVKNNKEILCLVEFSDLAEQCATLHDKAELIKNSNNNEDPEGWEKVKADLIKEARATAHKEAVKKFDDTRIIVENELVNKLEKCPEFLKSRPFGILIHKGTAHINPDGRKAATARIMAHLQNNILTSLPHGKFSKIKVLDINDFCSTDFQL